jgi:hypothetical protein
MLQTSTGHSIDEQRPHDHASAASGEGHVMQRIETQVEPLGTTLKMAIDRIVSELAEAESWEGLAQRVAKRRD